MVRVGLVLSVFNQAELRFLFPSWSLYGPGKALILCLDWHWIRLEIPPLILTWCQYGRGREKALVLAQVQVKALGLPLDQTICLIGAHYGFDRPRDGHEEQTG